MEIQLINIETYMGMSSNAEHFYAKVVKQEDIEDVIAFENASARLESLCDYRSTEELRYFPTKEEAEIYAKKDFPDYDRTMNDEERWRRRVVEVGDLLEYGTIRFPSVLSIVKTARERWPAACLYFTFRGRRDAFQKLIFNKELTELKPGFKELLLPAKIEKQS